MRFIGRREELETLETCFASEGVRSCAIYGRHRVGKTTLIAEFCKGKPRIRLSFAGMDPESMLERAAEDLSDYSGRPFEEVRRELTDFNAVLRFLSGLTFDRRTVVVFDEFQDAVRCFSDVPASLMRYMDGRMREQDVFLIVCGSSIPAMTRELNDGKAPLFQRFPVQLRLSPLSYRESRMFHPGLPEEEMVRMYAIASGIPLYHELMAVHGSAEDAIKHLFLGKAPPLFNEVGRLHSLEVSPLATYDAVLRAIGKGERDAGEVAGKTGLSKTRCRDVLEDLVQLDILGRRTPYNKRKEVGYHIRDGAVGFCYSVLLAGESYLDLDADRVYDSLRSRIDTFYEHRFEEVCSQYIRETEACEWCGKWWGAAAVMEDGRPLRGPDGKVVTEDADIDLVARISMGGLHVTLLGECRFTVRRPDLQDLQELMDNSVSALKGGEDVRYAIFSRSGFGSRLMDEAEVRDDLRLVSLDDIREWAEREGVRCRGYLEMLKDIAEMMSA